MAVVQLLPGVVLAPLAVRAGDRCAPDRALAADCRLQCLSMAVTAGAMWTDEPMLASPMATMVATCITFTRPVMGAVLPAVTRAVRADRRQRRDRPGGASRTLRRTALVAGVLMTVSTWRPCSPVAERRGGHQRAAGVDDRSDRTPTPGNCRSRRWMCSRKPWAGSPRSAVTPRCMHTDVADRVRRHPEGVGDVVVVTFADDRLAGGGGQAGALGAYGLNDHGCVRHHAPVADRPGQPGLPCWQPRSASSPCSPWRSSVRWPAPAGLRPVRRR